MTTSNRVDETMSSKIYLVRIQNKRGSAFREVGESYASLEQADECARRRMIESGVDSEARIYCEEEHPRADGWKSGLLTDPWWVRTLRWDGDAIKALD